VTSIPVSVNPSFLPCTWCTPPSGRCDLNPLSTSALGMGTYLNPARPPEVCPRHIPFPLLNFFSQPQYFPPLLSQVRPTPSKNLSSESPIIIHLFSSRSSGPHFPTSWALSNVSHPFLTCYDGPIPFYLALKLGRIRLSSHLLTGSESTEAFGYRIHPFYCLADIRRFPPPPVRCQAKQEYRTSRLPFFPFTSLTETRTLCP